MSLRQTEAAYSRIRNRIIEHLQLVASADEQREYQRAAPIAHVSNELFNAWDDWVADGEAIDEFTPPVFTPEEVAAIRDFDNALDAVARRTPQEQIGRAHV